MIPLGAVIVETIELSVCLGSRRCLELENAALVSVFYRVLTKLLLWTFYLLSLRDVQELKWMDLRPELCNG